MNHSRWNSHSRPASCLHELVERESHALPTTNTDPAQSAPCSPSQWALLLEACLDPVALHLPAATLAKFACASRAELDLLGEPFVRFLVHQRRANLERGFARGDIIVDFLSTQGVRWTLERLHLAEDPPRFPKLYFHFNSDELIPSGDLRVREVVKILRRHPGLCIRIEGHGRPSSPASLGQAVAQARAAKTRQLILKNLQANPDLHAHERYPSRLEEDPDDGVYPGGGYNEGPGRGNTDFYKPRLIGTRVQAIGVWLSSSLRPRPWNFDPDISFDDRDREAPFQRVEIRITGLLDSK